MSKGVTFTYFKYAIGEIILVMIGILLAMQINDWNENRKSKNELQNILQIVSTDLQRDTLVANSIITLYDSIQANSLKVINQKITKENHQKYPMLRSLVSVYLPFSMQTKGYDLLKKYSNQNDVQQDSLVTTITQFYTPFITLIDDNNQLIKKEVLENIDDFKKQPWFVDWTQQKLTDDMINYFTTSEDYRKKVASNLIFAIRNHKEVIVSYKKNAKEIMKRINLKYPSN